MCSVLVGGWDKKLKGKRGKMALLRIMLCILLGKPLYTDILTAIDASMTKIVEEVFTTNINV